MASVQPLAATPIGVGEGRFVLREILGVGGVGTVYRAHDRQTGTDRAIKVLALTAVGTVLERRFLREGVALRCVRHPNIVRVHSVGRDEPFAWIAMELVDGGTALQRIKSLGPLPEAECLRIIDGLLDGLAAVHALGWVHRDVKPGNILLGRTGAVKLSDFGVARDRDSDLTSPGCALGTLSFMAPEQMDDATAVTPCADLYSVGATLFALAAGRIPRRGDVTGPKQAPVRLRPLIERACAEDPADRFADAAEMRRAVQAARSGEPG